jgi:hypothetical protein
MNGRFRLWLSAGIFLAAILCACGVYRQGMEIPVYRGTPLIRFDFSTYAVPDKTRWAYQDFTAHFNFVREAWKSSGLRAYTEAGHRALAAAWLGETPVRGLAFAYSPILFVLLLPLLPLASGTAYFIFAAASGLAVACLLHRVLLPRLSGGIWPLFPLLICLFSTAFFNNLIIGQTALLTTAAVGAGWALLYDPAARRWKTATGKTDLLLATLLFCLAAKPHVALVFGVLLLAARRWRAIGAAATAILAAALLVAPKLGGWPLWWQDYLRLITHYNRADAGAFLRESINPAIATSFIQPLHRFTALPDAAASALCSTLWLTLLAAAFVGLRKKFFSPERFFQCTVLGFLLFSPNLMATEDFLLLLLLMDNPLSGKSRWGLLFLLFLFAAVNASPYNSLFAATPFSPWPIAFSAKGVLAGLILGQKLKLPPRRTGSVQNEAADSTP